MSEEQTICTLVSEEDIATMLNMASMSPRRGVFVEVGVYQGGTAYFLNELRKCQNRPPIHLFDTFSGMPEKSDVDQHDIGDFADTSLEMVKGVIPDAIFHVGMFPETLPDALHGIAFAHIDCDQYESIKACCEHLYPRMMPGGIFYFDDYSHLAGAMKAIDECFPNRVVLSNGKAIYVVS